MITTHRIDDPLAVEVRIKHSAGVGSRHPWVCLRFLGEDEIVHLLQDRLDKSESEVRLVLASYQSR